VRRASDALAEERPLLPGPRSHLLPVIAMTAAVLLWSVAQHWLGADPGGRVIDYMPLLIGLPIITVFGRGSGRSDRSWCNIASISGRTCASC
jgi:hypothetical protein